MISATIDAIFRVSLPLNASDRSRTDFFRTSPGRTDPDKSVPDESRTDNSRTGLPTPSIFAAYGAISGPNRSNPQLNPKPPNPQTSSNM